MRLPEIERDADGLPIVPAIEERVARAVAWAATLFFVACACWEIAGPLLAGHYASSASVGIIAENMWKWRILGPVWEYTATPPAPQAYYCHHPWGIFWTTALLLKVFGRHDFVCRLAPVLLSAATPPLLYGIGRALWRPAAGAAAALGFVVLPISLAFAHFNALEVPLMAWTLLGLFGLVRHLQTYRRWYALLAVLGFTLAMHADWPAFVLVAEILAFGIVRQYALPRRAFGPVNERRYAALWIGLATSAVLAFGLYVVLFQRSGKILDLLGAYNLRTGGKEAPLSAVLAGRRYWIELCFTPVAVVIGKIAAVVCAFRLGATRREAEAIPLFYLGMAVFQYVVFKQGADVHVFWPHTFAAYFALGLGALVATLGSLASLAWARRPRWLGLSADHAGLVPLAIAVVPLAIVLRDALPALAYARATGGRFNEKGALIDSDGPATAFLRWLDGRLGPHDTVELHEGMKPTWAQVWALGGRVVGASRPLPKTPAPPESAAYLVDTRFLLDPAQEDLAARFRVTAVGPFWHVDRSATGPIEAFAIRASEPSWLTWYLVSGTEPVRTIEPDPWLTWELRAHFGQAADPLDLDAAPATLEQKRVLHNAALAAGDQARARALFEEIRAALSPIGARFDDGTEIVGARFDDGACPDLVLVLRAAGPTPPDVQLTVRSRVTERARFSTTMMDPTEREVGLPLPIAPERWKRGFLYSDHVPIRRRPGAEVFAASFWSRRRGAFPKPADGRKSVEVLALPR
jgi:hypothetical protein